MKSPITLWNLLAHECASGCSTSATRDCKTVSGRFKNEGWSFLTITLPTFGKDFEKSLDQGFVADDQFAGFRRNGGLPAFLRGFLQLVFEPSSGVLLDEPDVQAIRSIRQLTLLFGKMKAPCSDKRTRDAFDQFVECELEVRATDRKMAFLDRFPDSNRVVSMHDFRRVGALLFRSLFSEVDRDVYNGELIPKHGPGATADRLRGNRKFKQSEWTTRLEKVFPARENLIPNERFHEELDRVTFHEPGAERPVRVISVPKTQKTPRIIAIEPACMQYVQQSVLENLRVYVEKSFLNGFIGTSRQEPNQLLAKEGSLYGNLATLDLSEASDRVSYQHVRALLANHPHLLSAVDACRSRKADVPGHGVLRLAKFASMGSALTFPIEAMVFLTVVFVGIERELKTPLTLGRIKSFLGKVRIYGDDIIVPVDYVQAVLDSMAAFGYLVNRNKSFWTGKFRESCGREFYAGSDVSIVRFRRDFPRNRTDVPEIISLVSFRNQLFEAGYFGTCDALDQRLLTLLRGHFPFVEATSQVLGRLTHSAIKQEMWDSDLQTPLVKGYAVVARPPVDSIDGTSALLKYFLKRGEKPIFNEDHLERSGRPEAVNIKLGCYRPY